MAENKGKISQVISGVVDVVFENGVLPKINNALHCKKSTTLNHNVFALARTSCIFPTI